MKTTDYKLVLIVWEDAESNDTWVALKDVTHDDPTNVASIGWLVKETPTRIVLVASIDLSNEKDMVSGHVTIPKTQVKEIKELTIKKPRKAKVPKVIVEQTT